MNEFNDWLLQPCLQSDCQIYPQADKSKTIYYLPIDKVRDKIRYMERIFGVKVFYYDLQVFAHNSFTKDTLYSATIRLEIKHDDKLLHSLCGATTFSIGQFTGNYKFGAIGKSLATVNALSSEFEQFGKLLNVEDELPKILPSAKEENKIANTIKNVR